MKRTIFPDTPKVTIADKERLRKLGFLNNWNSMNTSLSKHDPSVEDLKKLIQIELDKDNPRPPIVEKFIVRLQKKERQEIRDNIKQLHPGALNA